MKPYKSFFLLMIFSYMITGAQTHPYLFFNSSDITNIRSRATTSGTPANQLWNLILTSQANYYKNPANINRLASSDTLHHPLIDVEYENLYSLALANIIKTPQDTTYLSAIRNVLWGGPNVPKGMLYQTYNDSNSAWHWAPRSLALSLVYDLLYNDFTDNERTQIKAVINSDIYTRLRPYVMENVINLNHGNNHLANSGSALGIIAICLKNDLLYPGGPPAYPDAVSDIDSLKNHLLTAPDSYLNRFYSDGACPEGILYGLWGINKLLPFIKILSRYKGIDYFQDPGIKTNLQKISKWLAYELFPGTRTSRYYNRINDSDPMVNDNLPSFFSNLLVLSQCNQDGTAKWLFDNTGG